MIMSTSWGPLSLWFSPTRSSKIVGPMTAEIAIQSLVRWIHVLSGTVLAGGIIFWALVLRPAMRDRLSGEPAEALGAGMASRWRALVGLSTLLLLASGFYNFFTLSLDRAKDEPLYHPIFGIKFLAALGIFFLSAALVGRSSAFERMRADPGKWLALNAILATLVLLLGGILKSLGGAS